MVNRWRVGNGVHRIEREALEPLATAQYGKAGAHLLRSRLDGEMPDIFEYVTHAQSPLLRVAHDVWVHSLFAFAKLILESQTPIELLPNFRVVRHPQPQGIYAAPRTSVGDGLRLGAFGFVTPPKRLRSIISGLGLAADRLGQAALERISLQVVGEISEGSEDLRRHARDLGLADRVIFHGRVARDRFEQLAASCQVVFNLRYPSCGETSGTQAMAAGSSIRTITSRYQAFAEESDVGRTITTLPGFEVAEIADEICRAFAMVGDDGPQLPASNAWASKVCPVEKMILLEVLSRVRAHNCGLAETEAT